MGWRLPQRRFALRDQTYDGAGQTHSSTCAPLLARTSRVVGGRCGRPHLLLCLRDTMPVFEFIACISHFNWSGGLVWTLSRPNLRRARGQGGNRRDLTKPDLSKLPSEPTATHPRRIVTATHRTTCAPQARHIRVGSD